MLNNILLLDFSALTYTNSKIFTRAIIDKKTEKYHLIYEIFTNPGMSAVYIALPLWAYATGAVKSP